MAAVTRYPSSPARTTTPRSSSIRAVSTAYSGTPSAAAVICATASAGSPGTIPVTSSRHRVGEKRLERERHERSRRRAPARVGARPARAGRAQDEQPVVARPLEQILDEREQRLVGPLHVLEDEHHGPLLGHRLEESPPRRKEPLAVAIGDGRQPEQVAQRRRDPLAVAGIGDPLVHGRRELPFGRLDRVVLGDLGAHAHHLGQRPECDPVAVGEAAAAMPEHLAGQAVGVLLELPREP